jgi:N-dimethylarginine dimethylaminohydrolase
LGILTVGRIVAPGQVEGGDCLWLDAKTLLVGRGYRTNTAGIAQLRGILEPLGVNVVAFDLPHYHGRTECMHLMSLISPLDQNLAAVYLPLMPAAMVELLEERGIGMVEIPEQEFDSMGINILTVRPKVCVMIAGNTESIARVRAAGCEVHEFAGQEISLNRGGGPICLTRPIWRDA